tara:strand:+ start:107 stop:493 length:387 start_codon:yes stop_codon:yes gene_type:complete
VSGETTNTKVVTIQAIQAIVVASIAAFSAWTLKPDSKVENAIPVTTKAEKISNVVTDGDEVTIKLQPGQFDQQFLRCMDRADEPVGIEMRMDKELEVKVFDDSAWILSVANPHANEVMFFAKLWCKSK